MTIILLLSLILMLFPSCSPDNTLTKREIYLVSVADDFYNSEGKYRMLNNVITDQASLISQISTFGNVHIYCFSSQYGKRYTSIPTGENPYKTPLFKPYDDSGPGKGEMLDSPGDPSFVEFRYIPSTGEEESGWTMDTVLETIRSIESGENDLIIFTYSGHGEENTGAFATNVKVKTASSKESEDYDLTNKEIVLEALSSISGNKVLFLDSCYSGNFVQGNTLTTKDVFSGEEARYTGEDYTEALKKSSLEKSYIQYPKMWVMSSAGKNQRAWDALSEGDSIFQNHYGAFTYYLLKALGYDMEKNESKKESSELTFYSIYSYVRTNFPETEISEQTPRSSLRRLDVRIR